MFLIFFENYVWINVDQRILNFNGCSENKDLKPKTLKTKTQKSEKTKTLQLFCCLLANQVKTWLPWQPIPVFPNILKSWKTQTLKSEKTKTLQ